MQGSISDGEVCPRCGLPLKTWGELNADEKFVAERQPASADFRRDERKKHRFCTRCWFEEKEVFDQRA